MLATNSIDYGYPWWLSYGHLTILIPALAALAVGRMRNWSSRTMVCLGLVAAWAAAALVAVHSFGINSTPALPTQSFFRQGVGRVLDLGAGTGRSSIMVLTSRPRATLVALDLFGDSFSRHFGDHATPQDRLLANLKTAGVDQRASIETADMRKLPFDAESFDALVSAYAVDHLDRDGIRQSLAEANRVLKPGGDFLLILVANDGWTKFAFGPLLSHGGTRGAEWWKARAIEAGFQIAEEGTPPATLYLLLRRPAKAG